MYGLLRTNLPVPFGVRLMLPLVSVEEIVLPFKSRLSTLRLSNLLDASTIRADDAVSVPET
jgi:hypothetical protein